MTVSRPFPRLGVARWQVVLAVALGVAGFVAVTQFRTERLIQQQLNLPSTRLGELAVRLQEQERRREALEAEIARLHEALAAAEREAAARQSGVAALDRRVRELRMLAGFVPLEGPGVVIELRDSSLPLLPGDDPNKVILHYTDLFAVTNDLWAAGADAIAINGERIMALTGLNCVGTTILCNTKRIAPPYRIVAIGQPDRLLPFLRRADGPVAILTAFGFPVRLEAADRITVPAYKGRSNFDHARPAAGRP